MNFPHLFRGVIALMWITLISTVLWISQKQNFSRYEEKTIHVFSWPEMFLPSNLKKFEKETGIKVQMHCYTSNEELLVKLSATQGRGYDLIIPSDYAVKILKKEGLLKPLNHSKLNFLPSLSPALVGLDYDPNNLYALPYQWEIFGFGIDTDYFKTHPFKPSWSEIFAPQNTQSKIAMVNDPIEAVNFAAFYLYGPQKTISHEQLYKIEHLLKKQKSWVEAYAGLRADYLLATKNCQIALTTSSYIFRVAKNYSHVKFIVPEEWSFISIENISIPKCCEKEELVYTFLNFIYKPEILGANINALNNFPATTNTSPYLDVSEDFKHFLNHAEEYREKLHFIHPLVQEKQSREIWVNVKS